MVLVLVAVSSFAAFALSVAMLRQSLGGASLPGCSGGSACDAVAKSRWSRWGPIPIAALGLSVYFVIVVCAVLALTHTSTYQTEIWISLDALAGAATIAALWFLLLQLYAIRRFCIYCTAIHTLALLTATCVFWQVYSLHPEVILIGHSTSVALGALLVGGQIFLPQRRYAVVSAIPSTMPPASKPSIASPVITNTTARQAARELTNRRVSFNCGRVNLNVDDWPVIGSPNARHMIGWLFDHMCSECHHEHRLLLDVVAQSAGSLAIIAVPVPMHRNCNPTVTCYDASRAQACNYARLGWALWLTAPEAYAEWDKFMASEEAAQPFGVALQYANGIADLSQFNIREGDLILDRKISEAVDVYRLSEAGAVPAILLSKGILKGHVDNAASLQAIIRRNL